MRATRHRRSHNNVLGMVEIKTPKTQLIFCIIESAGLAIWLILLMFLNGLFGSAFNQRDGRFFVVPPFFLFPSVVLLLLQSSYPSIFDGLYQKVTHNSHLGVVFAKSLDFPLRFPSSIMHSWWDVTPRGRFANTRISPSHKGDIDTKSQGINDDAFNVLLLRSRESLGHCYSRFHYLTKI